MIIVITGSRKGIGRFLCEKYLEEGHTVIGCSRRESDLCSDQYYHYTVDITDATQIHSFAKNVRQKFRMIDVLINNAGAASMNHFMMTPLNTARKLMELNYLAALSCTKEFMGCLRKSEHGRVVNFSTVAVPLNLEGELAYTSSKAAVEEMTKIMAKEAAIYNVTVNAVGPTPIHTELTAKVPKEKMQKLLANQSLHRFGTFCDVKNVIDFYIHSNSDFITGQVIYLGGINR